jgi:hypothetical protein
MTLMNYNFIAQIVIKKTNNFTLPISVTVAQKTLNLLEAVQLSHGKLLTKK